MSHILESTNASTQLLPAVDPPEMAFAMELFVAAANGRIHAPEIGISGFPLCEEPFELLDEDLASEDGPGATQVNSPESVHLSRAISVLWHHYKGDGRQRAIWSRVVAFNAMMVRGIGATAQRGTQAARESDRVSYLAPAVIHAVATAPLIEFGRFSILAFQELVEQFAAASAPTLGAAMPMLQTTSQFQRLERLWRPFESLSGKQAFRSLLSRALSASLPEYPWLSSVPLGPDGWNEGLSKLGQPPDATQTAAAELAVVRSLVTMLQTIVGKSVTVHLIESLCPEVLSDTSGSGSAVAPEPGASFSTSSANRRLLV
jgi:hypothetical protein